jgi:3-hydroxyisobutyrate dehydrogenase-like beta-hydroxyacid dehydrogenase
MKVGYIGLGNMGAPIVLRLLTAHEVAVYDTRAAAVAELAANGAVGCESVAEVASRSEMVMLCLPSSRHVQSVLFGAGGVASAAAAGTVVIDQTTGDPGETRSMADELRAVGLDLVDAPVSGGPGAAQRGDIAIMVGADGTAFDAVVPVLEAISSRIFHAGGTGAGHMIKLVNNLVSVVQSAGSLEAMAVVAKNGADPARALEILLQTSADNHYLGKFVAAQILTGVLDSGFTLEVLLKDAKLACRLGSQFGIPMLFGAAARDVYQGGVNMLGANADGSALALAIDRLAGTHLVPPADH